MPAGLDRGAGSSRREAQIAIFVSPDKQQKERNEFLNKALRSVFGNKADRDLKELQPYVDQVNEASVGLDQLSNDELRAKTGEFRERIQAAEAAQKEQITEIRKGLESDEIEVNEKEERYKQIDTLEEEALEQVEKVLNEILPEAFAVVRETARRLKTTSSWK